MNCENFNDRLPEYLDETLSAAEQADVREHLEECGDCRQSLARQEAFAKSVRLSMSRETQKLSLHPETRQNILNALEPRGILPAARERFRALFEAIWRQPVWTGAGLFCLLLLISRGHLHRYPAKEASGIYTENYVVDVLIQTETHVNRRQNNMIVDALVTGTGVIDASFSENSGPAATSKPDIN